METYLLSDNDNGDMTDASVRLEDIIESKKYTTGLECTQWEASWARQGLWRAVDGFFTCLGVQGGAFNRFKPVFRADRAEYLPRTAHGA